MIEDYFKLLALGTVYTLVPPIVGKKILFLMMNMAELKLNKEELAALEKHFKQLMTPPTYQQIPRMMNVSKVIISIETLKKIQKERPKDFEIEIDNLLRVLDDMEKE